MKIPEMESNQSIRKIQKIKDTLFTIWQIKFNLYNQVIK